MTGQGCSNLVPGVSYPAKRRVCHAVEQVCFVASSRFWRLPRGPIILQSLSRRAGRNIIPMASKE